MCRIYHFKPTWNNTSDQTVRHCFYQIVLIVMFVTVTLWRRSKWQMRSQKLLRFLERLKLASFKNIFSITRLFIMITCRKPVLWQPLRLLTRWWPGGLLTILGRKLVSTSNYSGASSLTPWENLIDGGKAQDWCTTKWNWMSHYIIINTF